MTYDPELVERVKREIDNTLGDLIDDDGGRLTSIIDEKLELCAQAALAAAFEWRRIESAPRDGTEILAISQGKHEITGRAFVPAVVWWDIYGEGWTEKEGEAGDAGWDLTHWLPLPPAPEVKGE